MFIINIQSWRTLINKLNSLLNNEFEHIYILFNLNNNISKAIYHCYILIFCHLTNKMTTFNF